MIYPLVVRRITKERQWKKPGGGATAAGGESSSASAAAADSSKSSVSGRSDGADTPTEQQTAVTNEDELPPHWRELVDKKTNRKYYVNE